MISTQDLIDRGYQVRHKEHMDGDSTTHVCWKRLPETIDAAEQFISDFYSRFSEKN